jgi:hypothetical protein
MDRAYLFKVVLFYFALGVLLTVNRFFGGAVSEEFQFFANVALLLIAAASILILLFNRFKSSRARDKNATAAARAELLKEIEKKVTGTR